MELKQLRYLLAIAEERHMGRAADRLHLSQPALSQQLRKLEQEVGSALFERHTRGMRLTPEGEVLVRYANQVVQKVREARAEIDALTGLGHGQVTVGVLQSINTHLLPEAVGRIAARHPQLRFSIQELAGGQIEEGLLEGRLEFGIGFVPPRHDELQADPLFTEALRLFVAPDHPLAQPGGIELRQLNEQPLALLEERFVTRQLLDGALQQVGAVPRVVVETNTIAALVAVATRTGLPFVLPELAVADPAAVGLRALPLRNPTPRRRVGLLWRRGGVRSAAATALAEALLVLLREEGLADGG